MADFGIPFRCNLPGQVNGSSLCLNGGICSETTSGEFCICPLGSGAFADNTVGHFPNCGVANGNILPGIFGVLTGLDAIAVVVLVTFIRGAASTARRILVLILCYVLIAWTEFLGIYIQEGMFEHALVCFMILQVLHYHAMAELLLIFTRPIYALVAQTPEFHRFRVAIRVVEVMFSAISTGMFILCIVFARDPNPARYNLFMAITLIFQPTGVLALNLILMIQIYRLNRALPQSMEENSKTDLVTLFRARLRTLRQVNIVVSALYSGFFVFPILFFSLGSFPYQIALISSIHLTAPFSTMGFGASLRTLEKSRPSSTKLAVTAASS